MSKRILNLCGVLQLGAAASFAIVGSFGWAAFALAFGLMDFALAASGPRS